MYTRTLILVAERREREQGNFRHSSSFSIPLSSHPCYPRHPRPKVRSRRCRSGQSAVLPFRHLPPQIGEQIAPGDQPEKLVSFHDNGDATTIEDPKQVRDLGG